VSPPDPDRFTILIVDDEPEVLILLGRVLMAEGARVLSARDGRDAMDVSREYPGVIDAVITDLSMPKLDGLELRKLLSAERPGISVLLMSGYVFSVPDGTPLLRKPLDLVAVHQHIRGLLGSVRQTRHAGC
jgi:two-component system, cell cycle sensor histidine kinase and response regulator CckA